MKILLALLFLVPLVRSLSDLPTVRELLAQANPPCEDFIEGQLHTKCYTMVNATNCKPTYIYELIKDAKTFGEANDVCLSRGGYLASINSEEENNFVKSFISMEGDADVTYWIGGKKQSTSFVWQDNTRFDEYAADQSLTGTGECLGTLSSPSMGSANGDWTKNTCADTNGFICKYIYNRNSKVFISNPSSVLSWYAAEENCMQLGGNLATIHNVVDSVLFNCLLNERNIIEAWIGLNDLNKELDFQWSDYSLSRFRHFCHKPESDVNKDCVTYTRKHGKKGCTKVHDCRSPLPYICRIRKPSCDAHQEQSEAYLLDLLRKVTNARRVCKPCKTSFQVYAPKKKTVVKQTGSKNPLTVI